MPIDPTMKITKAFENAMYHLDRYRIAQRISGLRVTPEPNAVRMDFRTTLATSPIVEVFTLTYHNGELDFSTRAEVLGMAFDFLTGTTNSVHHIRIRGLPQARQCMYRITAGAGSSGPAAVVTGTFDTGRRDAWCTVREIQVWTDGDSGSAGDLSFEYGLYDESNDLVGRRDFQADMDAGDLRPLPFGTTPCLWDTTADDFVTMYVAGWEDDTELYDPFRDGSGPPRTLPEHTTSYEGDDWTFADAMQTLALPTNNGSHRVPFNLSTGPHEIFFVTNGWVDVNVWNPPPTTPVTMGAPQKTAAAVLPGPGARAALKTPAGRAAVFGLTADGVMARRLPRRHTLARDWLPIPGAPAEAAVVVAVDECTVKILAVTGGLLSRKWHRLDETDSTDTCWEVVAQDVQPVLSAAASPSGKVVVAALGLAGEARLVLSTGNGEDHVERHADLGGAFAGPLAVSWIDDSTIDVVGVSASGEALGTRWDLEAAHPQAVWEPLGGDAVANVVTVPAGDGAPDQLFALTAERRLLVRARDDARWQSRWKDLGSLDDIPATREPEDQGPVAPSNGDGPRPVPTAARPPVSSAPSQVSG
jgi:hypothetical protein